MLASWSVCSLVFVTWHKLEPPGEEVTSNEELPLPDWFVGGIIVDRCRRAEPTVDSVIPGKGGLGYIGKVSKQAMVSDPGSNVLVLHRIYGLCFGFPHDGL